MRLQVKSELPFHGDAHQVTIADASSRNAPELKLQVKEAPVELDMKSGQHPMVFSWPNRLVVAVAAWLLNSW